MIILDNEKNYFILVDQDGGQFGGRIVFEGIKEVADQFRRWAKYDDYEDPTLRGWTINECLEHWIISLKKYNGADFVEADDKDLDFIL